jgi:hypothetical protein
MTLLRSNFNNFQGTNLPIVLNVLEVVSNVRKLLKGRARMCLLIS